MCNDGTGEWKCVRDKRKLTTKAGVMEKRNEHGRWHTAGLGASVKDGISLQGG